MYATISKTKKTLIDAARELFASHGKNNTTMNDIAEASNKGRRTLYTYFKNKDEVYKAVIENEVNIVMRALSENAQRNIDPYEKLKSHIIIHLESIKNSVTRNGTLRADFFRDIYEVERTRRKMDTLELGLIQDILEEGIEKKEFKQMDTEVLSTIILYSLKGLEVPYIRQNIPKFEENKEKIVEVIFKGIRRNH